MRERSRNRHRATLLASGFALIGSGCELGSEPPRVEVPVFTSSAGIEPMVTDLGYEIHIETLRLAMRDLLFTVGGEEHAAGDGPGVATRDHRDHLIAYHPGHAVGGEVLGELPGDVLIDMTRDGELLGEATLIANDYDGAALTFRRVTDDDGLRPDDPLIGYSVHLEGTATRDGESVGFEALLDLDGVEVTGVPFDVSVSDDSAPTLGFELRAQAAGLTLFDRFAFFALDADHDGQLTILPGGPPHEVLAENLGRHEHYAIGAR